MLVQFVNNQMRNSSDSKIGLNLWSLPIWLSSEFFSSNYLQIGQHVVLLHICQFNTHVGGHLWHKLVNMIIAHCESHQ